MKPTITADVAGASRKRRANLPLVVSVAVAVLLAALSLPHLVAYVATTAKVNATRRQAERIRNALVGDPNIIDMRDPPGRESVGYFDDLHSWPPPAPGDADGLTWLSRHPPGVPDYDTWTHFGWRPYIQADSTLRYLRDAWGHPFRLVRDKSGAPVGVVSNGPDGVPGRPANARTSDDIIIKF